MRKRRKRQVAWFPTRWFEDPGSLSGPSNAGHQPLVITRDGTPSLFFVPLVLDQPVEEINVSTTAIDRVTIQDIVQGNEYIVRRIVGKCWHVVSNEGDPENFAFPPAALITMGIFVARTEDEDPTNYGFPIGATTDVVRNYSPQYPNNIREPWMFRRTWLLGNNAMFLNSSNEKLAYAQFPPTNSQAPSSLDGPHIDAKSARRVHGDERLWMVVETRAWPPPSGPSTYDLDGHMTTTWDFRVLGTLTKARNRSTF